MAHTFVSIYVHATFSTKNREKIIDENLQERLWHYMSGIAHVNKFKAIAVGGTEDHVHLLLSLLATISVSKAMQLIKAGSSKWIHENFPDKSEFTWQEGYAAFSVGISKVDKTVAYIKQQAEHHRKIGFQEEYLLFLKEHVIEYDERYIWG